MKMVKNRVLDKDISDQANTKSDSVVLLSQK